MATLRKLIVEVVEARNLLPKDGHGTSSPYVLVDIYGQRRRTRTEIRNLNPTWNEVLEFNVGKPSDIFDDMLEVDVYHDKSYGPTSRNDFLGRLRLNSTQFVRKGEEALLRFPLEKRSLFSWIQGNIGLRIYYVDEVVPPPSPSPPPAPEEVKPEPQQPSTSPPPAPEEVKPEPQQPTPPTEVAKPENEPKPPAEAGKQEGSAAPQTEPADADKPNEGPPAEAEGTAGAEPEAATPAENGVPEEEKPTELPESEPPQPTEESKDQAYTFPVEEFMQPPPEILMMAAY